MQIGLKAERAAFTNAPLALPPPSPVSFPSSPPLAPLPLGVSPQRNARAGLKMALPDSYARLRRATRAGKKSSRTHPRPVTVKIARMLEIRGNRKCGPRD